jgi:electron transfer flavoprotein beta subunit
MKIMVLIKHVPDAEATVQLADGGNSIDKSSFKYVINPCDEYAVEEALKTQQTFGGESIVVCVGEESHQESVRKALAMGIDRGILVTSDIYNAGSGTADSYTLASWIKQVVDSEKPDIIFCGLNTTDGCSGNLGPMLAEMLDIPSVTNVSALEWSGETTCVARRDVEGGLSEFFQIQLPALLSAGQSLNTPRFPTLPGIMKAKKKTISIVEAGGFGSVTPGTSVANFAIPKSKPPAVILEKQPVTTMVDQLVELLKTQAKVL